MSAQKSPRPPMGPLLLFIVLMTLIMSVIMSFSMTWVMQGFTHGFLFVFGLSTLQGFFPGLIAAFVSQPIAQGLVRGAVGYDPFAPPAPGTKPKFFPFFLFTVYMSALMTIIMSFAMTGLNMGFDHPLLIPNFLLFTCIAFWPALVAAFIAQPVSQKAVKKLMGVDPLAPPAAAQAA